MSEELIVEDFRDDIPWDPRPAASPLPNPILDLALELIAEGISAIPLKARSKEPALDSWKIYQERLPTEDEVRSWFADPALNIGIICGSISGNLFVLDFDTREAAEKFSETYAFLVSGAPIVKTARGFHVYLRGDTAVPCMKLPGIDVKGQAGYVVGPGSTHPSGAKYKLLRGDLAKIPVIEPELLGFSGNGDSKQREDGWEEPLLQDVLEGERHNAMVQLCGRWYGKGLSESEVQTLAQGVNSGWTNPLPEKEIVEIVRTLKNTHDRKHPQEEQKPPPRILTVSDILKFSPPRYVVEPHAPAGAVVALTAFTGTGKTVVTGAVSISAMSGLPFLGKFKVHKSGPVLYFDEESPQSYLKDRLSKMGFKDYDPFYCAHFTGLKLDADRDFDLIGNLIAKYSPVFVVFDTLIRFHTRDENSATEMAVVMDRLRKLANLGPCIWVQIHQNKSAGDIRKRSRGSSDIIGGVDLELALTQKEHGILCLQSVKARMAPIEKITLKIEVAEGLLQVILADEWSEEASLAFDEILSGSVDTLSITKITEMLKSSGTEISRSTVVRMVTAKEEAGDIECIPGKRKTDKLWKLTKND